MHSPILWPASGDQVQRSQQAEPAGKGDFRLFILCVPGPGRYLKASHRRIDPVQDHADLHPVHASGPVRGQTSANWPMSWACGQETVVLMRGTWSQRGRDHVFRHLDQEVPQGSPDQDGRPGWEYHRQRRMSAIWPMIRILARVHHGTEDPDQDASVGEGTRRGPPGPGHDQWPWGGQ